MKKTIIVLWVLFGLGFIVINSFAGETTTEMINNWKKSASEGSPYTPFYLGYSYKNGQGVKKNLKESFRWFSIGAERGDMQAALELANMYMDGKVVKKNDNKAIDLYVKIGKSDTWHAPIARIKLLLYARNYSIGGEGVTPNKIRAKEIFKRLFEVEQFLMDKGSKEMHESVDRANSAIDNVMAILNNMSNEEKDEVLLKLKKESIK